MPVVGFKCEKPEITGRDACQPEECMTSCLEGAGCRPASYMATVVEQMGAYSNSGTISGSGLLPECDFKVVKEKTTDFLIYPADLHWASFRGALVHEHLEKFKKHPGAKDWLFEKRFYALIQKNGTVIPITLPEDKEERKKVIDKFHKAGCVVLSGQIDAFDAKNGFVWDYKTTRFIREETKESYIVQVRFYSYLLRIHGYAVKKAFISMMDASEEETREVELGDLDAFVESHVVPTARKQRRLLDGDEEPKPTINFLCLPKKETGRIYCRVQSLCPEWQNPKWVSRDEMKVKEPSKCYGCYYYLKKDERQPGQPSGTCPSGCPNLGGPIVKTK